jgi:hypothetical protein
MENVIKNRPSVGDIMVIIDGKERFISGANATKAFIDTQNAVGVVYQVQGNNFKYVGGVNNVTKPFSCVADYEITAIPPINSVCEVVLNSVSKGSFTYTESSGTIAGFADQLNGFLNGAAPKWEAYTNAGHSYLQMKTYDAYEGNVSITGVTLVKLIASELASYTIPTARNQVKQIDTYHGMNRSRLEAWATNNAAAENNPSTEMNGTTQLYAIFPCSKAYYDGVLGGGLRANFATYALYLDACMVRLRELGHGIMKYRDGKILTNLLKDKKVLKAGVLTPAYSFVDWCVNYDSGVSGYGAGTFYAPSVYEGGNLMSDEALNLVNVALTKKTGWSQISQADDRWFCGRNSSDSAWFYYSYGILLSGCFYGGLSCSAVSASKIKN